MCGIGGFFSRPVDGAAATARSMLNALAARGPDASHVCYFSPAGEVQPQPGPHALLHARLSIIDPRPAADQPMASDDGRYWLCYNGEVYGWQDDARQLMAERPFRTRSDTEFILRGAEAWGIAGLLPRLTGMFAFALVDWKTRELLLVRDRFGKKPLLWWSDGHSLAFSSMVRGVLPALPAAARAFSMPAIDAYLAHRYVPAPLTVFAGIQRLPAGHLLRWPLDGGTPRVERWYPGEDEADTGDWKDELDRAILQRCVADRPVGLFLSGGIDSSLIACRLAAHDVHFDAFTAAFPGSSFDESPAAAALSRRLGLAHHAVEIPGRIRDDFPAIVASLDEPFADPSAIPLWYLARETTRHVKVVLGGDGGDELLAGYKRYRKHLRSAWRRSFRLPFLKPGPALLPGKYRRLREEIALPWSTAYMLRFSGFSPAQRSYLQPGASLPDAYWAPSASVGESALASLLDIDMANYLPEYILRKGDLTTMGHGLELRAPLLDHRFVRSLTALPPSRRFARPAKSLFAEILPADLAQDLFGAKKRGFNPPLTTWLQDDLMERYEGLGNRLQTVTDGGISGAAVDELCATYRRGANALAENVLQLLVLDESLHQLGNLA
ncbi:asparagine synthase (glutamine-hydrolyzing) [Azonexus sp. R2A61]|uniref:asparagine synthase (glutamine-hydrolyzing) n=1 Tax=Azonexus sp. R2A61 TaxID=2744443 RepID=UPI001F18A436|nr:asparagine synthase (glutamine-hydrolyzing) [Azonexus sp. R2A61]